MFLLAAFIVFAVIGYIVTARRGMPLADRLHRSIVYGLAGGLVVLTLFAIAGGLTA